MEAYIEAALLSMLGQTVQDFELLFLDDGSTDNTFDVAMRVQDPRIRVLRNQTNQGIARSLNRLLDTAKGAYLAHMDADDICLANRLEQQLALMEQDPALWVCGSQYYEFDNQRQATPVVLPVDSESIKAEMLFRSPLAHPFVTLRGDVVAKYGIRYDTSMPCSLDYALWLHIAASFPEARFANVDQMLGLYRRHEQQITTARAHEQLAMALKAQRKMLVALGIAPENPLIQFHVYLYVPHLASQCQEVAKIFEWALLLKHANAKRHMFQQEKFESLLAARLFLVSQNNMAGGPVLEKFCPIWPALKRANS